MKGIPQLSNAWGSMINLLDAVLVNGFNYTPVLNLNKSTPTAITATINLGSGHGFIDRQVIRLAGSTNGWNGDYKVLSVSTSTITIECPAEHAPAITGTATCFTAPLDFEIVYQTPAQSTTPKRAYRSTDPESLGLILLVHDFCVSGAAVAGAKFAKVGIVSGMTDIDTINGTQMPFDSANLAANWGWDGTYHGWAKWYYKLSDGVVTYYADTAAPSNGDSVFYIAGDTKSFVIDTMAASWDPVCTISGYCEFYDESYSGKNLALIAQGIQRKIEQNSGYFQQGRCPIIWTNTENQYVGKVGRNLNISLWFNSEGVAVQSNIGEGWALSKPSSIFFSTSISGDAIFTPIVLVDTNSKPRGVLPFLRNCSLVENIERVDSKVGKHVARHIQLDHLSIFIRHALLLETQ